VEVRAVVSLGGTVTVIDRPDPVGEGELLTITSTGICGSDLHMLATASPDIILGHEFGGRLTDGTLVAVRPTGECGTCPSCAGGHPSTCSAASVAAHGITHDGGLAEFAIVDPSRLFPVPTDVDPASLGLAEPLAVVIHGINRVSPAPGSRTLVVGAGSIGLLTAAVLRDRGVKVDVLARHSHQAQAAEELGAAVVSTAGKNYDISFDAVCTQDSFNTCVTATRPRGSILEFGMVWSPVSLNNLFILKEITLVPSIFYGHDHQHHDFKEAVDILHRRPEIVSALVTHRYPLSEAPRAFATAADKSSGAIKVHLFND
jgi:threonine dehydrogenase-like Zn-dependent dehydrogenase